MILVDLRTKSHGSEILLDPMIKSIAASMIIQNLTACGAGSMVPKDFKTKA